VGKSKTISSELNLLAILADHSIQTEDLRTKTTLYQVQSIPFNPFTAGRNYATPRLSAEVAFVRPEREEQSDWLV
jgi:adenine C2-methylase RlmN of 23S rRNA A2503 and tRNA A37